MTSSPQQPLIKDLTGRMSTLGKFIYSSTSAVRNYILPSLCLSCDTPIAETGHVCAKCWASIRHIEPPYCPIMGNPFSHDLGENVISAEAIANPPSFDTSRSVALYDDQARIVGQIEMSRI